MFKQPRMPAVKQPDPLPNPPTMADSGVANAGQRQRANAEGGVGSTIATSPLGVMGSANTTNKSLLGQ